MNPVTRIRMRQILDWKSALWSGIISGTVFLVFNMLLSYFYLGSPWIYLRMTAAIVLGEKVLPPPMTPELTIILVGALVHYGISILLAFIISLVIYRWGILVGILGGALLGVGFYLIKIYGLSYFFPWFYVLNNWVLFISHVLFGATAGGVYELLEKEEFIPVNNEGG